MRESRPVIPSSPHLPPRAPETTDAAAHRLSDHEQAVLDAIRATPFGTVEVVLHQGRITQVVRTQKLKLKLDTE